MKTGRAGARDSYRRGHDHNRRGRGEDWSRYDDDGCCIWPTRSSRTTMEAYSASFCHERYTRLDGPGLNRRKCMDAADRNRSQQQGARRAKNMLLAHVVLPHEIIASRWCRSMLDEVWLSGGNFRR